MIKYSPENEESAVERIEFVKDGKTITLINRFDTYAVYVDTQMDKFHRFCSNGFSGGSIPANDKTVGAKSMELIHLASLLPAFFPSGNRAIKGTCKPLL